MALKYIDQIDLKGKRVLIRVDFNVPMDDSGAITDDRRIRVVLPTLNYCLDHGAKVILASHLGRPKGKRDPKLSLLPVAKRLSRLLGKEVIFAPDCIGEEVERIVNLMKEEDVVLLENLRFHEGEENNDEAFGKKLAALCDIYINDAFATAHRVHASNVAITKFVKEKAAGFLMRNELEYFKKAMESPVRPFIAVIGGVKVSDKIKVLENLSEKVDKFIIGGFISLAFIKAMGYNVGNVNIEEEYVSVASEFIKKMKEKKIRFYLPVDYVIAQKLDPSAETKIVTFQEIPDGWIPFDIGPATTSLFSEALQNGKTIIWNGPMGAFEIDAFSRGTFAMVQFIANCHALTIVGGGDTDVAFQKVGQFANVSYISTGGGAFLELLQGKTLPAIKALE